MQTWDKPQVTFEQVAVPLSDGRTLDYVKLHETAPAPKAHVSEAAKHIPIAYDCDVAVAGAGVSGLLAALAAAHAGARTVLIDRFGEVGGNLGPGWYTKGGLEGRIDLHIAGGRAGLAKEMLDRLEGLRTERVVSEDGSHNALEASSIFSYLGLAMCEEAGVELVLSAYAADPIVTDGLVQGLFVEGKSGRVAVRAKVVVDGTGDASIAERGGAPMICHVPPKPEYGLLIREKFLQEDFSSLNDTGLPYAAAGLEPTTGQIAPGVQSGMLSLRGQFDTNSMFQISALEKHLRMKAFEQVRAMRKRHPKAYLLATAPYIGARGGPCIKGEHVLTIEEAWKGEPVDDALYRCCRRRPGIKEGFNPHGFWVPYRIMLPQTLDGMLVVGRGASYIRRGHDGPGIRPRISLMAMGEAAGFAAASAAREGTTPKTLAVKQVQAYMAQQGYVL